MAGGHIGWTLCQLIRGTVMLISSVLGWRQSSIGTPNAECVQMLPGFISFKIIMPAAMCCRPRLQRLRLAGSRLWLPLLPPSRQPAPSCTLITPLRRQGP